MMRLQKYLAMCGVASRRKAETLIADGLITVNGEKVTKLGTVIDENADDITYNGKLVKLEKRKVYIALNKPSGYVSSTVDKEGKSVLDLVKLKERIYPVGRLDRDSSGLLLLTNDGDFAEKVMHPRNGSEKEYFVVLDHDLKPEDIRKLEAGHLIIDGKRLQPIKVTSAKNASARLVLREGVNREVRRVMGKLNYSVKRLKRIRVGGLELGTLEEGQWKHVTPDMVLSSTTKTKD